MIEENDGVRQLRMARVGDVVLLDCPADSTGPRSIDCYLVKMLDFTSAASGGADAKRLKVGPDRLLYSLRWKHTPAGEAAEAKGATSADGHRRTAGKAPISGPNCAAK